MLGKIGQFVRALVPGGSSDLGALRGAGAWSQALIRDPAQVEAAAQVVVPAELPAILKNLAQQGHAGTGNALAAAVIGQRELGDDTLKSIARALSPAGRQAVLGTLPPAKAAQVEQRGFMIGEAAAQELALTPGDLTRFQGSRWACSPELESLHRQYDLDAWVSRLRSGEAPISADEKMAVAEQLGRLPPADLKVLREALVERPPHPRLREMKNHPALKGPPTARGVYQLVSGEPLGLRPRPSAILHEQAVELMDAMGKDLNPADRAEWVKLLASSDAACSLVMRQGPHALKAISALGLPIVEDAGHAWLEGRTLVELGAGRDDRLAQLRSLHAQLGPEGFRAALKEIGELRFGNSELVEAAMARGGAASTLELARALNANPHGHRALASLEGRLAPVERLLGRSLPEQKLILAEAGAQIAEWGSGGVPMKIGASWPEPRPRTSAHAAAETQALTRAGLDPSILRRPRDGLSAAELGQVSRALKAELQRRAPDAAAQLDRELKGRRFINYQTYDRLYEAGVTQPELFYSPATFESWSRADAHVRAAASASRGRPLAPGELTQLMQETHRAAGQGMVDVRESHLKPEDLGRLRDKPEDHVQLGNALTPMSDEVSALLDQNPYLAREQLRWQDAEQGKLVRGLTFAPGQDVPGMVAEVDAWVRQNEGKMPTEQLAAELHWKLVSIHPFMDGNGRTSKLMADFVAQRAGAEPPVWRDGDVLKNVGRWPEAARRGLEFELATVERYLQATVDSGAGSRAPPPRGPRSEVRP